VQLPVADDERGPHRPRGYHASPAPGAIIEPGAITNSETVMVPSGR
jgi:hypothetical protein